MSALIRRSAHTILAIDDARSLLVFYRVVLSRFGKVRTASTLDEAAELMNEVDLIIVGKPLANDAGRLAEAIPRLKRVAPVLLCEEHLGDDAAIAALDVAGRWQRGNDHEQLCWLVRRVLGAPDAAVPPAPTFQNLLGTTPQ